jgi:hypothetical protein
MCNYCVNNSVFSFLSWGDGSCNLVCEVVFIDIPCAATVWLLVCFLFLPWVDGSCSLVCQARINWYTMCSYCVNIGVFSFLPWCDGSCSLVCEVVFIDIPCATTVWILVCFLFLPWVDGSCSLVCQAVINWYTMCSYCVFVQCETCICFLFCRENWWKMLSCLLMLFIAVKMIVSTIVCKWVLNIVSAIVCMGASVWNICMCYCNCCLSYWICHRFLEYMLLSLVQLLLKFIYINCVYFVRCQLNLQLLFLEYNLSCFLDDFGIC